MRGAAAATARLAGSASASMAMIDAGHEPVSTRRAVLSPLPAASALPPPTVGRVTAKDTSDASKDDHKNGMYLVNC